jgi:predicted metal-binding membrane protein
MWAVMMVAMMAPTATPTIRVFARAPVENRAPFTVPAFGLGYLTVWLLFSVAAAALQVILHQARLLTPDMSIPNRHLATAILLGAGLFQFTPFKHGCLTHCRSPLEFFLTHWKSGRSGAFQMGLRHGVSCVSCCWAVMTVLFVVGVMNLWWVGLLAVFILIERIAPHGDRLGQIGGAILILIGLQFLISAGVQ